MKTIWKYPLKVTDWQQIELPVDYEILSIHTQHNNPCLWILVDPDNRKEKISIRTYGTGHLIDLDKLNKLQFIGTYLIHQETLVFHVFSIKSLDIG